MNPHPAPSSLHAARLISASSAVLCAVLLAACAATTPPAPAPAPSLGTPAAAGGPGADATLAGASDYLQAAKAGQAVYRIDPARSLVAVTVRRGGTFAKFGHDHVIASRTLAGYAAPDAGRADFAFRLDQMTVDEPALRLDAGLDTQPDADAIAGTRNNMLTRVLGAARYPLVQLHAETVTGQAGMLRLTVTLHGVSRTVEVATSIERSSAELSASGKLTLRQTDFGITPMSVFNGAMTVQDAMELRFRIVALPVQLP